jgi:hypothetical protein
MRAIIKFLFVVAALVVATEGFSQTKRRVIQLSGIVRDSSELLIGAHVYVPKAGRGDITNQYGFFSMPALVGDSVVISMVGYHRASYIVPDATTEQLTILIELTEDPKSLNPVLIMGFPTEELFKEAILAMNIPSDNRGLDQKALNAELIALMARATPMDGNANYKYYIDQWSNSAGNTFRPVYNPFLDPLNWARFIKSFSNKKKKK